MKEVVYSEIPRVTVYEDVVDHEFCDYIINKFTKQE